MQFRNRRDDQIRCDTWPIQVVRQHGTVTIERIDYSQYTLLSEDQLISHQVARRIEYHNHPRNMPLSNCGIMLTYEGKDRKRVKGMARLSPACDCRFRT